MKLRGEDVIDLNLMYLRKDLINSGIRFRLQWSSVVVVVVHTFRNPPGAPQLQHAFSQIKTNEETN